MNHICERCSSGIIYQGNQEENTIRARCHCRDGRGDLVFGNPVRRPLIRRASNPKAHYVRAFENWQDAHVKAFPDPVDDIAPNNEQGMKITTIDVSITVDAANSLEALRVLAKALDANNQHNVYKQNPICVMTTESVKKIREATA